MNGYEVFIIVFIIYIVLMIGSIYLIYTCIKSMKLTKENSPLYKKLLMLNNKYSFKKISQTFKVDKVFKSKASLENFSIHLYIEKDIQNNYESYENRINTLIKQNDNYDKYCFEYNLLKLTNKDDFEKINCKIKYILFNICERILLKKNFNKTGKQSFTISYHGSYTSPAGRNHYTIDKNVDFNEVCKLYNSVKKIREISEYNRIEEMNKKNREKEKINQARKEVEELRRESKRLEKDILEAKENKIRIQELKRLERNINERENDLYLKEKEFENATKNHIYSSNTNIQVNDSNVEFNSLSVTQKLKVLREMFDNGEITYEEYKIRRGAIL